MSEIKQEILDLLVLNGRKPQTIKNGERVVYLYDALNIVNKEFSKTEHPQLNENQQASINEAKKYYRKGIDLYDCSIDMLIFDDLSDKEWAEATVAFLMWALEQEEEK